MKSALAHSGQADEPQLLSDHLLNVSNAAAVFASGFDAADLARAVGMLHDVGKLDSEFQAYLAGERGTVDHKLAGTLLAKDNLTAVMAIHGHHGGLGRSRDARSWIEEASSSPRLARLSWRVPEVTGGTMSVPPLPIWVKSRRECEFFTRMLFSALVDADYLDTEAHFDRGLAVERQVSPLSAAELAHVLDDYVSGLTSGSNPLRALRSHVYRSCIISAALPPGVFRLTVPTGGGKTLAGMAFALHHAAKHGLRRVISAIPYTSIIEQNADVYRSVFGNSHVLEHHSAISEEETENWSRLAAENWDASVIVTTTVQLFESLFAHKPSRCRKLHNISESVILLDEVQALPTGLLEPILEVLRELTAHYRVSVVLCSATQPAFENSEHLRGFHEIREIVPDYSTLFRDAQRVNYSYLAGQASWAEIASVMREHKQALAVVNTKKDALALLGEVGDDALHLSTLMCGAHRRDILAEVRARLSNSDCCRLVSTQVVEAGVDIDFPVVMRALGPLDRIVQAGGRCNREGAATPGRTIVFTPLDGHLPHGPYRSATDITRAFLAEPKFNFHDPENYTRYFRELWQVVDVEGKAVQQSRDTMDFPRTAELFRMIKDDTVPVAVRYPHAADTVDELLEAIRRGYGSPRKLMRSLQPFVVNVNRDALMARNAPFALVIAGLYEWTGQYDAVRGLVWGARDPADFVV